jgi:DNA-binding GntR family transcriptional regulator
MTRARMEATSGIKAVQVQSLAEAAAQMVRDAIISGKLKPGERLVEQKLAAQLAIGQPTLREALKELEHQGFVRKVTNRGSYITDLTKEDFEKIHHVRMILEAVAVEQAAAKVTPSTLSELEATVEKMDRAARKDDRTAFHKADLEFHRAVWAMSGNEYLASALERLIFSLFAFVLLGQEQSEFIAAVSQHRDILEGLRSGNSAQARETFIRSTNRFWQEYHQVRVP